MCPACHRPCGQAARFECEGAHAAEGLDPNSSAALLIWEDTWAIPLVEARRSSGGVLLEGGRIPLDLAEEAFAGLASAGA